MPPTSLPELMQFLTENPMLIVGTLLLLTIIVYLSKEHSHIRHKTKTERNTLWVGWGLLMITLSLFSLFTTALHLVAESANLLPEGTPTGYVTLYEGNSQCQDVLYDPQSNLTAAQQKGCQQVNYGFYSFLGLLVVGVLFAIVGLAKKRQGGNEATLVSEAAPDTPETHELIDKKYCVECGKQLPRSAKHCSECGSQQPMR